MTTSLRPSAPPLNPFPLFMEYSACVFHVIDFHAMLDLSAISNPILLSSISSYILFSKNSSNAPKYLVGLQSVLSFNCMLTLLAYQPFFFYKRILSSYILYHPKCTPGTTQSECTRIYPQTVAILSEESELESWTWEQNIRRPSLPQIFFFTTTMATDGSIQATGTPGIFQGYFICWYCNLSTSGPAQTAQAKEFTCGASCGKAMKLVVESNIKNFGLYFWRWMNPSEKLTEGQDPFTFSSPTSIDKTMGLFLNENYKNGTGPASNRNAIPQFHCGNGINGKLPPTHIIITGSAASFNFITSAGITDAKTCYFVYFAPFTRDVWLTSLLCGLACLITASMCINIHASQAEKQQLLLEMSTWTVATIFGQYKSAGIPILSPREMQQSASIHAVVVCWLLTVTLLYNFYQATFNSDATTLFPYSTKFSELWQLENCTLYIPVNETLFSKMINEMYPSESRDVHQWDQDACLKLFHNVGFPQCNIIELIETSIVQDFMRRKEFPRRRERIRRNRILNALLEKTRIIPNTLKNIERMSKKMGPDIAFVVFQHEFHYYWGIFEELMKQRPDLKFANNFGVKATGVQRMTSCTFTAGLQPKYQKAMTMRLSRLTSSGINGLWEKWDRIRFSFGGLHGSESKPASSTTVVAPLSFHNSGTPWLFFLIAVCWVLASLFFALELMT